MIWPIALPTVLAGRWSGSTSSLPVKLPLLHWYHNRFWTSEIACCLVGVRQTTIIANHLGSSMDLLSAVEVNLKERFSQVRLLSARPRIYSVASARVHVRTANEKAGAKYWFDVTPSLYERGQTDFLMYTCGSPSVVYVFPVQDFMHLVAGASLGGQKQVPNFTIYVDRDTIEPSGHADEPRSIAKYRNAFGLVAQVTQRAATD